MSKITVIDSIMGGGKTTWCIDEILNKNLDKNILYITPYLNEIDRIISTTNREMCSPKNQGGGKLDNIKSLINHQIDIASTHELFKRFDDECINALDSNEYTLILDETLTAVEPYKFEKKDDYEYLLKKGDIKVTDTGLIEWTGDENLDTRFNDIRILSKNNCLFKIDNQFFLWHFPHKIFEIFSQVYILTYLFDGSILKYYFDLYNLKYDVKSIKMIDNVYSIVDYFNPDKSLYKNRFRIYEGKLNENIGVKSNVLSVSWCNSQYNKDNIKCLQKNMINYTKNITKSNSRDIMWTAFKSTKKALKAKGYSKSFVACNMRATNDYSNTTCLMYCCNWFVNPEIKKFFEQRGITIDEDMIALSNLLQWIWRCNIRVKDSDKIINIYIPSIRMRQLFINWLKS